MKLLLAMFDPVWRMPLLLAMLSVFGLMSALLADAPWDTLSWLALGVPVVIVLRFALVKD
jgi:hypothetical protein